MKKLSALALLLALPIAACSWGGSSRTQTSQLAPAPSEYVRQAQQKLADLGLYRGQVDGIDGAETHNAIRQFQQQHGLTATGMLDQGTDQQLLAKADNNAPNANANANNTAPNTPPSNPQATGTTPAPANNQPGPANPSIGSPAPGTPTNR